MISISSVVVAARKYPAPSAASPNRASSQLLLGWRSPTWPEWSRSMGLAFHTRRRSNRYRQKNSTPMAAAVCQAPVTLKEKPKGTSNCISRSSRISTSLENSAPTATPARMHPAQRASISSPSTAATLRFCMPRMLYSASSRLRRRITKPLA